MPLPPCASPSPPAQQSGSAPCPGCSRCRQGSLSASPARKEVSHHWPRAPPTCKQSPHPICAASSARTPASSLPPRGRPDPDPSAQPRSSPYPESLVGAEHRRDLVAGVSASHAAELAHQPLAGLAVVSHLLLVLWAHQTLHGHEEAQQSFRTPPPRVSPQLVCCGTRGTPNSKDPDGGGRTFGRKVSVGGVGSC